VRLRLAKKGEVYEELSEDLDVRLLSPLAASCLGPLVPLLLWASLP
jgi:hypothetical protein